MQKPEPTRRSLMAGALAATAATALPVAAADESTWKIEKGRINQSVIPWCFQPMKLDALAHAAASLGLKSVELCPPESWPMLKQLGLKCAIASGHGFTKGWNHVENHDECLAKLTKSIDALDDIGWHTNVITFSGMKNGIDEAEGMKNTVNGLKKIVGYAEKKNVTLAIEVLNSRVNVTMKGHPDYQADKLEWAVEVCDKIGSPRMKILFDIYHIQIMEGDVISRIRQYKDYIAHYHTAGVPGRNELDDDQEINYPPIMRAILETGYTGFVGQEFIPRSAKTDEERIASLRQAVKLCDV
jgi:hydroxypyruvate isomerase